MFGTLFFFFISFLVGKALIKLIRIQMPVQRVVELVVGIVVLTLVLFFLAWVLPFNGTSVGMELGVVGIISLLFLCHAEFISASKKVKIQNQVQDGGKPAFLYKVISHFAQNMKLHRLTPVVSSNTSASEISSLRSLATVEDGRRSITLLRQRLRRVIRIYPLTYVCGLLRRRIKKTDLLVWFFFIILAIWLFSRSLFFNAEGQLIAGDRLVWVDWPVHMGLSANFAWGQNFPPTNPTFAGIGLIYPFFADFLSAILLVLGASIPLAYVVPGIILTLAFFALFVEFTKLLLPKSLKLSRLLKFTPLFLSLFWGGLGWVYWLQEVFSDEVQLVERLLLPPREYTFWADKGLWFFTFLYSEILPQRAFLFGLPLFCLIVLLCKNGIDTWESDGKRKIILAGVISGILPFFHTHTFLSVWFLSMAMGVIGGLSIVMPNSFRHLKILKSGEARSRSARQVQDDSLRNKFFQVAFLFFVPLGILTLVQLPLFLTGRSIPFEFGWMKGTENFFLFWFKNTGLFIPLMILGLWKGTFSRFAKLIGWSSFMLFILPNLFRFANWGYDNLKIFTFWYLLGSIFVSCGLLWLWNLRRIGLISRLSRTGTIILFTSLTLSGILEVSRIADTKRVQIGLWSQEDLEIAQEIRQKTPPSSIFLTAAIHDHPVATLAGRKIVIGYPGNSWSWGIDGWSQREQDVRIMLKGEDNTPQLLQKYHINYVYLSGRERYFQKDVNEAYFATHGELILQRGDVKVYKIR